MSTNWDKPAAWWLLLPSSFFSLSVFPQGTIAPPPSLLLIPPPSDITPLYSVFGIFSPLRGLFLRWDPSGFDSGRISRHARKCNRSRSPSGVAMAASDQKRRLEAHFQVLGRFLMLRVRLRPETQIGLAEPWSRWGPGSRHTLTSPSLSRRCAHTPAQPSIMAGCRLCNDRISPD